MPDDSSGRRVVIAGASGLIGSALTESLRADGVSVTTLVRRPAQRPDEVEWLTDGSPLDPALLEGAHAVIGMNGASIGRFPWTPAYKHTLLRSRIIPTRTLATAVKDLGGDAPVFVSASAVGYYGSTPGRTITEHSPRGESFLSDLTGEWESAAMAAGPHARVVLARTAPIVHREGVLKPLVMLTRFGVSGPIGHGRQVWPWISLDDEIAAIRHVIQVDVEGPVNLTSPTRTTANDLGFALAVAMNRPFVVRAPVWGMKLVLGADATRDLLTADMHVVPEVLERTGFTFAQPTAEDAVAAALREA